MQKSVSQWQGTILQAGIRKPGRLGMDSVQFAFCVRDVSASMEGDKAQEASAACQDLLTKLAHPSNRDGFYVAVVDFEGHAVVVQSLEKATCVYDKIQPISTRGCTNMHEPLQKVLEMIESSEITIPGQYNLLRPVVLLFSDGGHNTGEHPQDIADRLKQKADIVTVAFGNDAEEKLLINLASTPQHFYRCADGDQLRAFMAQVGYTLQQTHASAQNATYQLTQIRQN